MAFVDALRNDRFGKRERLERPAHDFEATCDDQDRLNELIRKIYGSHVKFIDQGRRGMLQIRRVTFDDIVISQWAINTPIKVRMIDQADPPLSIGSMKAGHVGVRHGTRSFDAAVGQTGTYVRRPDVMEVKDKHSDVSVHIPMAAIRTALGQRLTFTPQEPLRFERVFFAPELLERWNAVETTLLALGQMERCPPLALANMRDHAIGLLLDHHPNNFGRFLLRHDTVTRSTIRDAMQWMKERAGDPITVGDAAEAVGCSLKALTRGFLEYARGTPSAYLYSLRLDRARELLRRDPTAQTAIEVALETGFVDIARFERCYAARHGERAAETLQRNRPGIISQASPTLRGQRLSPDRVDLLREHIEKSLGGPIRLTDLSRVSGMKIHNLLVAFRHSFGTTPAQYILAERMRRVRWLLEHTPLSIAAIAAETGFSSQSHLCIQFKLKEQVTPMQYRRSILLSGMSSHAMKVD
jgi:transcriptional regulator GlxA family with amidase domain